MKKLLVLAIIAGAFTMTSCKKEYTCTCTTAGTSVDYKTGSKVKKSDATKWCDAYDASAKIGGGSCKLK